MLSHDNAMQNSVVKQLPKHRASALLELLSMRMLQSDGDTLHDPRRLLLLYGPMLCILVQRTIPEKCVLQHTCAGVCAVSQREPG